MWKLQGKRFQPGTRRTMPAEKGMGRHGGRKLLTATCVRRGLMAYRSGRESIEAILAFGSF